MRVIAHLPSLSHHVSGLVQLCMVFGFPHLDSLCDVLHLMETLLNFLSSVIKGAVSRTEQKLLCMDESHTEVHPG